MIAFPRRRVRSEGNAARIDEMGGSACIHQVDVTSEDGVRELFRVVRGTRHRVDILVNERASPRRLPRGDEPKEVLRRDGREHGRDVSLQSRGGQDHELPAGRRDRERRVCDLAAAMPARRTTRRRRVRSCRFTRTLTLELAGHGVHTNTVTPGLIATDMTRHVPPSAANQVPLKRFGTPCEVANVVAFLASRQASYITGATSRSTAGCPPNHAIKPCDQEGR